MCCVACVNREQGKQNSKGIVCNILVLLISQPFLFYTIIVMSVAAMTMDDQRPLMNSYEKMSTKYEQSLHITGGVQSVGGNIAAPPSGPASPTPSGSEDPPTSTHQYHHQHHHHHHHLQAHQQQQQDQQSNAVAVAEAVAAAEQRHRLLEDEIENLKLEQTRLSLQCADGQRREKILMRRLANKEQEFQDYVSQIAEYKAQQAPTAMALRSALLDPAVNLLFDKLKKELRATKAKLEETQNELSAWKFTPDSNTGKRLMAKCRLLYSENEELGKMTSNGRLAKLETELAMQKSFSEEVKKSQSELDDFLQELDEDVEGMQSTIIFLQQELKTTRDRIQILEKENNQLKNGARDNECMETQESHTILGGINSGVVILNGGDDTKNVTEIVQAINYSSSGGGGDNMNSMLPVAINNNEIKTMIPVNLTSTKLDIIEENDCLRTNTRDFYNGNEQELLQSQQQFVHDASINISKNGRLARKRNFEEDIIVGDLDYSNNKNIEAITSTKPTTSTTHQIPPLQVNAPRTLPPKKSKLRGIAATRRSSIFDDNETHVVTPLTPAATPMVTIVDNTVVGMVSDDFTTGSSSVVINSIISSAGSNPTILVDETITPDIVAPQRVMTRRRSVRMQQNGSNGASEY